MRNKAEMKRWGIWGRARKGMAVGETEKEAAKDVKKGCALAFDTDQSNAVLRGPNRAAPTKRRGAATCQKTADMQGQASTGGGWFDGAAEWAAQQRRGGMENEREIEAN